MPHTDVESSIGSKTPPARNRQLSSDWRCNLRRPWSFLFAIGTLNIPSFLASLGNNSTLALSYVKGQWEAVRGFLTIFIPILLSIRYMSNDEMSTILWFLLNCSLLHAFMALISSTILTFFFAGYTEEAKVFEEVNNLDYQIWTFWDLVSVPAIWTLWSIITFIIGFLITVGHPTRQLGNITGSGASYDHPIAARVMLILLTIVSISSITLFLLYLRYIYRILASRETG